jgi:hypothetical protein
MKTTRTTRRDVLRALAASAFAFPLAGLFAKATRAEPSRGRAKRFIVFYFPDGVPAPPGQASRFHPTGRDTAFALPENLRPLERFRGQCVFFRGLSLGPTDAGSHPGGAKKLLTAVDGGGGESIDRYLARTAGASARVRHVYLGAMAGQNNASGDKFISYPSAGTTVAPQDDPRQAFGRLFGTTAAPTGGGAAPAPGTSALDLALADLRELRALLDPVEKAKLELHLEAYREVEKQVTAPPVAAACGEALPSVGRVDERALYDAAAFPALLKAQTDVLVQAMACGLSRVSVLQCSQHTSELIMSRFPEAPFHRPGFDMRSHQASHYGETRDSKFADYVQQRTWFVEQFAYLLSELSARPEDGGTMLDHSVVLLCSEVSDGNDHGHDDMPFVLAGGGGGAIRTGRLLDSGYRRHADLLVAIARAMGESIPTFGEACAGPLPGLLA